MSGREPPTPGLFNSVRALAASLVALAHTRLELLGTELQEELDELSVTHPSATVRYKAYIASCICSDPEWFAQESSVVTADEDQFFISAAHRLQQKLFGLNF